MDKLIKEYNKECNYTSKLVNRLWKIGQLFFYTYRKDKEGMTRTKGI